VMRHLTMYSIGRDVSVEDRTGELALISIVGPAAAESTGFAPLARESEHATSTLDGIQVRTIKTDLGLDVVAATAEREAVLAALERAGVAPVSEEALEILRVESGRPRFGREMTQETIPQEAGINERAVSFTKGCYIGQETVARLHYKGKPNRHLRGLRLPQPVSDGTAVTLGEKVLGKVGTAVLSPVHGPIALAVLRREAQPGDEVLVGGEVAAEVVDLPFEPL
ncbi:MAG: folate-binding protein, partial [Actinomycetota bacterium]|nr:folate-binding protein [Actinomycetota bacterium]